MIAHLIMYDRPETAAANDRFWLAIRDKLGFGPDELTRDGNVWDIWQNPDLLFSQTCGMPYRTRLHGKVQLVGTPDYGLPGCPPGHYCSVLVARKDCSANGLEDLQTARFAYNEPLSQSGWAAPATHFVERGLSIGPRLQSGGHQNSARMVAEGAADFAALDALTWELVRHYDEFAKDLTEIGRTAPTPTLPFITANGRDAAQVSQAVHAAIASLDAKTKAILRLRDLVHIPAAAYLAIPTPEGP